MGFVFWGFLVFPRFFWVFCFFSDFGGSSQESPRIVFLFSHGFEFFLFFLICFLSFIHIYQCVLVLIVALMHLPNIYENVWKTKTQAPWPPLLF